MLWDDAAVDEQLQAVALGRNMVGTRRSTHTSLIALQVLQRIICHCVDLDKQFDDEHLFFRWSVRFTQITFLPPTTTAEQEHG